MLSLSSSCRYYLYAGQTDMRKSHSGLSGLVREAMTQDPLSGDVFIFLNKKLKLLHWEGDGLSIYYKKLEQGTYELPALDPHTQSVPLRNDELMLILQGISLGSVKRRRRFDRTAQAARLQHVVSTERYAHVTDKLKMEAINKLAKIHSGQID